MGNTHSGASPGNMGGSPKPKRNIFEGLKNTLRPNKSKSQENSSSSQQTLQAPPGGGGNLASPDSSHTYANVHSVPYQQTENGCHGNDRTDSNMAAQSSQVAAISSPGAKSVESATTTEHDDATAVSH